MKNMTDIELADAARDLLRQLAKMINELERRGVDVEVHSTHQMPIGGPLITLLHLTAERVNRTVL